ncbi:MAG: Flp family type IVb pilin [Hyphomicrobiales bacterium]
MDRAANLLRNYADDDSAVTAIEYGLIASIISIAIAMVATQIGASLQVIYENAASF